MTADKSAQGRRNRTKGADFERWVVRELRHLVPDAHRGSQSQTARSSDVVIPGVWVECEDSKHPNPEKKMDQVRRDLPLAYPRLHNWFLKVVICHRTQTSRGTSLVTMEIGDFRRMLDMIEGHPGTMNSKRIPDLTAHVQLAWPAFLQLLSQARPWERKEGDPPMWAAYKVHQKDAS